MVTGVLSGVVLATVGLAALQFSTDTYFPILTAPPLAARRPARVRRGALPGPPVRLVYSRISAAETDERLQAVIVGTEHEAAPLAELRSTATDGDLDVVGFVLKDPSCTGAPSGASRCWARSTTSRRVCTTTGSSRILITTSPNERHAPDPRAGARHRHG